MAYTPDFTEKELNDGKCCYSSDDFEKTEKEQVMSNVVVIWSARIFLMIVLLYLCYKFVIF